MSLLKPGVLDKLEFHCTLKPGSWLNMAEIDFSLLARQCRDGRIPDEDTLHREVAAWENKRNAYATAIQGQFTAADARIKLKQPYPPLDI